MSDNERDNLSATSQTPRLHGAPSAVGERVSSVGAVSLESPSHNAAAVAALQQHQRALNYSTLAAAAAVANGAAGASASLANGPISGASALTPNEALLAASDANAAAALALGGPLVLDGTVGGAPSSTETLLRNIQSLLKVAADNARQQERQISYEKGKCSKQNCHRLWFRLCGGRGFKGALS